MTEKQQDNYHESKRDPRRIAVILLVFVGLVMAVFLMINLFINTNHHAVNIGEENASAGTEASQASDSSIIEDHIDQPVLKFEISGGLVKEYDLGQLIDKLKIHRIIFTDPYYEKEKRYAGFALQDVLQLGFGDQWKDPQYTDVAFGALDGYTAIASILKLRDTGGFLVYQDLDYADWEPISSRQVNPGPFYLVWTGKDQTTANEYPWPWELESIDLIKFQKQYPEVVPEGASSGSPVYLGFQIFEGRCIRCHSMNGQGGKVGPDLNAPQSIVSYRSENMIKEFIKNPSKYRHTHMPDNPDLTDLDLDNLIYYFNYMNENRN